MRLKKRLEHKIPFPEPLPQDANRKPFLAVIAIVILVSFIGVLNHLEKESITGSAVQTISFVKEGKELNFEVKTGGIKSATIHLTQDTKNAKIIFEEQEAVYPQIKEPIYSFVKVSSDKAIHFSALDLELKLKEEDLQDKSIASGDVQLYVNAEPVKTTLINSEKGYIFYTATAASFGDYVIGKKRVEKKIKPSANKVTTDTLVIPSESDSVPEEPVPASETPEESDEENIAGAAALDKISDEPKNGAGSFWGKIGEFFKSLFD